MNSEMAAYETSKVHFTTLLIEEIERGLAHRATH